MTQRIRGKIRQQQAKGSLGQQDTIVAQTVKVGAGLKLGDLSDVDITGESDGVMMIFDGASGTYKVTTQIQNDNLNIIGGTY
tara:strand:- start:182 stop:427 length:246 start_codon:yes stop_codon:yes gene_type:complete